jgi:hypothetical protein
MLHGAGNAENEHNMQGNLRSRNVKSGFDCNDKIVDTLDLSNCNQQKVVSEPGRGTVLSTFYSVFDFNLLMIFLT